LDFQALLVATLRAACAVGVEQPAILDAKIGVLHRSIFEGLGADGSAFENAAAAQVLNAKRSVHPCCGRQIKSITEDEALARALANVGNEDTGRADFAAGGGGGVREPNERHAEKTEVGVDERHGFVEGIRALGA